MTVRVRFAPSPTGAPHVGNIRTALFTWLLARHSGGAMVLRIEDTDRTRLVPGSYGAILDSLRWLGIDWDEGPDIGGPYGPYVQSERLPLYQEAAERLVKQGNAYYCFCTVERLGELRAAQQRAGRPTGYDRRCRYLGPDEVQARLAAGEPHVIRFAIPTSGTTVVQDAIRGPITFDNAKLDDHVLLKSDGFPTYQLAATLDDELMRITHVLRGEEWISSAPRHQLFHEAMGVEPPVYAQLPLILGPDRKKLSKRNGDAAVSDYRDAGYLPDALFNFLGTLGWSLDDKTTLISRDEFIKHFDLDRVGSSPAMWDMKKLEWMNGEYIRALPDDQFLRELVDVLEADLPPQAPRPVDREIIAQALPILKTRLPTLAKAVEYTEYLFPEVPLRYDREALLGKKFQNDAEKARDVLDRARERFAGLDHWDHERLEATARATAEELGLKFGDFLSPIRIAITGRGVSLPLLETMEILGKDESLRRLDAAMALL
jgi:glutamyl-tRNA synthetase